MATSEFTVESMKHCFICLDPILSHFPVDPQHDSGLQSFFTQSLWNFSSYLKMDLRKVFNDNDSIPQHLLDKVKKAKLKGELCDECSLMNDEFSKLYQKLIKIEMELASSLQLFQNKLTEANETGKGTKLRQLADSKVGNGGWDGKLDILEVLRAEAIQKCFRKLNGNDTPRVKIENLTMKEVNLKTKKLKRKSVELGVQNQNTNYQPKSDKTMEFIKADRDYSDPILDDTDTDYNSDYQDFNASHDTDGPATSWVNQNDSSINDTWTNHPGLGNVKSNGDDLNNPAFSFEVVIPTESQNVEKPQPSVDPTSGKRKCNLCPKEFSNQTNFKAHYDSAHLKVKYKCTICGMQFAQLKNYKVHHQSIHLGVKFRCRQCNKIFAQKVSLRRHQKTCNSTNNSI